MFLQPYPRTANPKFATPAKPQQLPPPQPEATSLIVSRTSILPKNGSVKSVKGARDTQEDCHIFSEWRLYPYGARYPQHAYQMELFGVFDGHGGGEASKFAAKELPVAIRHFLVSGSNSQVIRKQLKKAFVAVQHKMRDTNPQLFHRQGTTVCVILVITDLKTGQKKLYCANAGDSRAILVRASGTPLSLSSDHKPSVRKERERLQRLGELVEYDDGSIARIDRLGLSVSRGLGDLESLVPGRGKYSVSPRPDVTEVALDSNKDLAVLVACDGLWDVLNNREAAEIVLMGMKTGQDSKTTVNQLVGEAMRRRTGDNVTVLLQPLF